ncbi:N-acetylmuramoyl-L-alanine amidase [Chryseomicrobium palamuruense]
MHQKGVGAQVFFHEEGEVNGEPLAKDIQSTLRETLQNTEREAMGIRQIYLLKKANAPSVLVETGFISNEEERALLQTPEYQQKIAHGIVDGLEQFFQSQAQATPTPQGYAILIDD